MLVAKNITKSFGSESVLRDVSIGLELGELVGLIGASGGGKTVLARCLVGLEVWDAGSLAIDGIEIARPCSVDDPQWRAVRTRIGLVAQNRAVPPYRRVRELICEGPVKVQRMNKRDALERTERWVKKFGLEGHLEKFPHEISGGQLARVCLVRALALSPSILICDEITSPLDPEASLTVGKYLVEAAKEGVGVLVISHQLDFLKKHSSRIDFLSNGEIETSGTPEKVFGSKQSESLSKFIAGIQVGD